MNVDYSAVACKRGCLPFGRYQMIHRQQRQPRAVNGVEITRLISTRMVGNGLPEILLSTYVTCTNPIFASMDVLRPSNPQ